MTREKWMASMMKKLDTDEDGVRLWMKIQGAKAGPTDKPKGFAYDKVHGKDDYIKEMSKKALNKRWHSTPKNPS